MCFLALKQTTTINTGVLTLNLTLTLQEAAGELWLLERQAARGLSLRVTTDYIRRLVHRFRALNINWSAGVGLRPTNSYMFEPKKHMYK